MFVFIVGIITAIICIIYFIKEEEYFFPSVVGTFLISIVFTLAACLISLVISGVGMGYAEFKTVETRQDEIVCLQDNVSMNARRYAYRACINEKLQYTYLTNEAGKGITSKQIPADDTYIHYTEDQPKVIQRVMTFSNPILGFFSSGFEVQYEYDLYLPEGSIAVEGEYNIDLQ